MISMTEIINWLRNRSDIYIVHNSAFKPNNLYFNDLQAATDFFNTLILFIGVHHSSDEDMMGDLYHPRNVKDFSTLRFRQDWPDDAVDLDEMNLIFYVGHRWASPKSTSEDILYQGTLMSPYNDIKIKGPDYKDYIGIWKGRNYLPAAIESDEAHKFNHPASQVDFIKGYWLETLGGTYEISLGKINIDE